MRLRVLASPFFPFSMALTHYTILIEDTHIEHFSSIFFGKLKISNYRLI
jgi:hypothetical protein